VVGDPEGFDRPALSRGLAQGCLQLDLFLTERQQGQLLDYLSLLSKWNAVYNLTAIRKPKDMLSGHVLDSLTVVPLVRQLAPKSLLDVGSGAGLPGIPIAIAVPSIAVTLVDAVRKKVAFQLQVKAELALPITAIHARVEALTIDKTFDCVISRAFSDLKDLVWSSGGRVAPGGVLVAMKGLLPASEIEQLQREWNVRDVVNLSVPEMAAQRCAVVLERAAARATR